MTLLLTGWGAADILRQLEGDWTLHRRADGRALMDGEASFSATDDGGLIYREHGEASMPDGQSFHAERSYLYRSRKDGFSVFFPENPPRLFHDIGLTRDGDRLFGDARHPCGDDLYLSRYEFFGDGTFTTRHDVSGPRKKYVLETSYARKDAA